MIRRFGTLSTLLTEEYRITLKMLLPVVHSNDNAPPRQRCKATLRGYRVFPRIMQAGIAAGQFSPKTSFGKYITPHMTAARSTWSCSVWDFDYFRWTLTL